METRRKFIGLVLLAAIGYGIYVLVAPHADAAKDAVDATADFMTGKSAIDHGEKLQGELQDINNRRNQQILEATGKTQPKPDDEY
ncbi:MAG: hypothetical protein AAF517_22215 [Planctomycetota bacterium]